MATPTTNYEFDLPVVGGDEDQWGDFLNANWTQTDALFTSAFTPPGTPDNTTGPLKASVLPATATVSGTWTFTGGLVTAGPLTSRGISDGAANTALDLTNQRMLLGDLTGYFIGRDADGDTLEISGSNASDVGANLLLHGSTGGTANDWEIRKGASGILSYDDSAGEMQASVPINMQAFDLTGVVDVVRGVTNSVSNYGGGSIPTLGGRITVYGEAHATFPGDVAIISNDNVKMRWDESADLFNFNGNDLSNVGTINGVAYPPPSGGSWSEWDLGTMALGATTTQAHGFGAYPADFEILFECTSNDIGYAVGDRVKASSTNDLASGLRVLSVGANTTNVFLVMGSQAPALPRKNNQNNTAMTASRWKMIFRAIAP